MNELKVIAYDFDGTIYDGDSSIDFYIFAFLRRPYIIVLWPIQIFFALLYILKIIDKTNMKEVLFIYLRFIGNKEKLLTKFWNKNYSKIKDWYLIKNHKMDVIISASPEFLLKIPCKKIGVKDLIASEVDINTGKFLSKNCHGNEKVKRIKNKYKNIHVLEMYTDSKVDKPMIDFADKGFMVKKNTVEPYYK